MVIGSSVLLEFVLAFLVVAAVLLFIAARFFKIPNRLIAIITAFVLFSTVIVWFFQQDIWSLISIMPFLAFISIREPITGGVFYEIDHGAQLISILVLIMGFLVSLYNTEYLRKEQRQHTFYPLIMMMLTGIIGMLWSADLLIVYLFSELMNICAYALVAFRRKSNAAIEAGFKYLMMSSVASVIVLAGISILFYTEGTVHISNIEIGSNGLSQRGALFILSGLC